MFIFWLILLGVIIFAAVAIGVLASRLNSYRKQSRKVTSDYYTLKTNFGFHHKLFELNKSFFGHHYGRQRKSPVLITAEEFKANFKLGKYVILCSERNMMSPMMGLGYRLKELKSFKTDYLSRYFSDKTTESKSLPKGLALDNSQIKQLVSKIETGEDSSKLFGYIYKLGKQYVLFLGEDSKGELARYCTVHEFSGALWPMIYNICRNYNNIKKYQEKSKSLQGDLRKAQGELSGLSRKLKHKSIDLHMFYKISNRLFTIHDEKNLFESFIKAVDDVLTPSNISVLIQDEDNSDNYHILVTKNGGITNLRKLKFPVDDSLKKLMKTRKQAIVLPLLSSGLPGDNLFLEVALSHGYSVMEKLAFGGKVRGLVLIGDKADGKNYSEPELEIFSTLTNMASLALSNLNQYRIIEKMSYTDFLTEIYNYRYFYKRLREEIFRAKRFDRMLALVIFDIDNFKSFNDTYGHQAGDEVLKKLAALVTNSVRAIDIVSRYGGEEFCIIMPDTGFANCLIFIERLRKMIERHKFTSNIVDDGYSITVSIGGAIYPVDALTAERFIYCADMALLKAKNDGRNRTMMFNSSMLDDEELVKSSEQQLTDMGIYEDL